MNEDEEFAFNLRLVLGAQRSDEEKSEPTAGPSAGFDNLTRGGSVTNNFAGPAEVYTAFFHWAMLQCRVTRLVDWMDRAFRILMNLFSLVLMIVLAATGYLFDEPDVLYEIDKIHWFGWVVFGLCVAMALFSLGCTQLPRFLTMKPGGCSCDGTTWNELPSLLAGPDYRAPLRNWTQGIILLLFIVAFGGSSLVVLLHSIVHMLLWGLSWIWTAVFALYMLSMIVSAVAEANRHKLYAEMYAAWNMESPILLHRLSCYRTLLGTTMMPILAVAFVIVAEVG